MSSVPWPRLLPERCHGTSAGAADERPQTGQGREAYDAVLHSGPWTTFELASFDVVVRPCMASLRGGAPLLIHQVR